MKANSEKSHLLVSSHNNCIADINGTQIISSKSEKLLGVTIDKDLSFATHISNMCTKAAQKLNALARISPFMSTEKKKVIMKAFISSQFSYCPLIWMCHSRTLNNKINRIHERSLRIVYNDNTSSFEDLLERDNSVLIHHRNLQVLATEMFKIKNGLSNPLLDEIFTVSEPYYDLRSNNNFQTRRVRTVRYGTESLSFLGPKIWNLLPLELKNSESLNVFKARVKSWRPINCPCRLCRLYIPNLGFI